MNSISNRNLQYDFFIRLRRDLVDLISEISAGEFRNFSEKFFDFFIINRRFNTESDVQKIGIYNSLLLGYPDKDFLLSAIGIDPKGIFNEGAKYNISIQRSFRNSSLSISFVNNIELEDKHIKTIRNSFFENNNDLDINRYLSIRTTKNTIIGS